MNNKRIISVIAVIMAVLMLIGLVVGVLPASVFAEGDFSVNTAGSVADLQKRKEELAAMAAASQEKIAQLQDEQATLVEQKVAYDERDAFIREEIAITDEQIALYQKMIDDKQLEVDAAKALEDEQLARYRTRVRAMEENGNVDMLGVILNAGSLRDLLTGIDDVRDIMESDRRLEDQYVAAREEHERVRGEFETEKAKYDAKMDELKAEQEQLKADIEETEQLMKQLELEIETTLREYEAAVEAERIADRAIDAIITRLWLNYQAAHANDNTSQTGGAGSGSGTEGYETHVYEGGASSGGTGSGSASLAWPVPGCYNVSSDYGYRTHPVTGEVQKMHTGMDIDGYGHDGGDIVSCGDGVVTTVGYNNGYGNYIIVDHGNGVQTLYAHMSGTAVAEGTTVGQGETIGYLGATGVATGTHCHLEVFVDGERVDPADYVG